MRRPSEHKDAGSYEVIAKFIDTTGNYNDIPNMKATLIINKASYNISGILFNGKTVMYDGNSHSLEISGTLPSGVTVVYLNNNRFNIKQ